MSEFEKRAGDVTERLAALIRRQQDPLADPGHRRGTCFPIMVTTWVAQTIYHRTDGDRVL